MRVLGAIWAVLIWIFLILIPVQFYLAGHGAMEGAHSADKAADHKFVVMSTAWDPHVAVGTIMALITILILIAGLAARLPARLRNMTLGLFGLMLLQFILPFFNDSAGLRIIAAFHAVNALAVTGIAIGLAIRSRPYLPVEAWRGAVPQEVRV